MVFARQYKCTTQTAVKANSVPNGTKIYKNNKNKEMEEFKDAEKKARLLTRRLIDKLVKSTASGSRALESELHIRHGFIKAV